MILGRYAVFDGIASGGMATVHVGRLLGPAGFARTVAVKRMHPHLARDADFVAMFTDEARLAARVRHGNVVPVLDVVAQDGELFLVMEYVQGDSLASLLKHSSGPIDPKIASAIAISVLDGLHAAHEAKSDQGTPLGIVHRDVTPQNVLLGVDGIARLTDFGIAKAVDRLYETRVAGVRGKLGYVAPEQLVHGPVDRRSDVYSAAVVCWEMLVGERLHAEPDAAAIIYATLEQPTLAPSVFVPEIPEALEAIVMKGLQRSAEARFATAKEMAQAIESAVRPATPREVAQWVERVGGARLAERAQLVARIEREAIAPVSDGAVEPPPRSSDPGRRRVSSEDLGREGRALTAAVQQSAPAIASAVQEPQRGGRRSLAAAGLGVGLALVLAVSVLVAMLLRVGQRDSQTPSVVTSTSATAVSSSDATLVAPATALPSPQLSSNVATAVVPPQAPSSPATAGVSAQAEPSPTRPAPVVRKRPAPSPSPVPPAPSRPNCDVPFFIDSTGLRRPRSECFPH